MAIVDRDVIFVYSEMQFENDRKINANIGKTLHYGEVSVGASKKKYSKIINESDLNQMTGLYPDTKIVTSGKLSKMNYTEVKAI